MSSSPRLADNLARVARPRLNKCPEKFLALIPACVIALRMHPTNHSLGNAGGLTFALVNRGSVGRLFEFEDTCVRKSVRGSTRAPTDAFGVMMSTPFRKGSVLELSNRTTA